MARDPRKGSAFDSGMRGREKPKIADAHGKTAAPKGDSAGNEKQHAGGRIGDNTGVDLSAYTSGMRGPEKPKQKPAAGAANYGQGSEGSAGGENRQAPDTQVGNPDGHNDAGTGKRAGVDAAGLRSAGSNAKELGVGSNLEQASQSAEPEGQAGVLGEEDDTHINLRIPKASLKRKATGFHAG